MALYLEVLKGESPGTKYAVKVGFRLGRNSGEIIISDKKISSLHAQIEQHEDRLILVDRGSSNGLLINNQRAKSVILSPGVIFTVGRTQLQVIESSEELEHTKMTNIEPHDIDLKSMGWKQILKDQIPHLLMQNKESSVNLQPFSPALRLDFIQGPETDRMVVIGYGPRKFGSSVLDVELFDQHAPFLAFEITPEGARARITTSEYGSVKLNNRRFSEEYLSPGDVIQVGHTLIKISHYRAD